MFAIFRILAVLAGLAFLSGCSPFMVDEKNMISQERLADWNNRYEKTSILRLKYDPAFPGSISKTHPLYKKISIGTIEGVPDIIRNINIAIASRENFLASLKETLEGSNLLHSKGGRGKYALNVKYIDSSFPPLSWSNFMSFDSISTTKIQYVLQDVSDGSILFNREIESVVTLSGGQGWVRQRKAKQFSHMTNFASFAWCLENFNGQKFPRDCSLQLIPNV